MIARMDNPFRITKSNDLTDEQIDQLWVTTETEKGFTSLSSPSSVKAMFVLGGKGSGKSHLMRYYSFPLQLIRYMRDGASAIDGVRKDKYLGIYARCGGMDSARFYGKGQPHEIWDAVFAYYFELWVADRTLGAVDHLLGSSIEPEKEVALVAEISGLFDRSPGTMEDIRSLRNYIANLRKEIDYTVNNAAFTRTVDVKILLTRGNFFFGIPKAVCKHIKQLSRINFIYLLDEFENFPAHRQMFINTLIRERDGPTAFKVGARSTGVRTRETFGSGERNLQGSEFEELRLDERFRRDEKRYGDFCRKLIDKRLAASFGRGQFDQQPGLYSSYFETVDLDWNSQYLLRICPPGKAAERPHITNFQKKLERARAEGWATGLERDAQIKQLLEFVRFDEYPIIEKICILYVYQQMFRGVNLLTAGSYVRERASAFVGKKERGDFGEFVSKYKSDMVAQILRDASQKQVYAGVENFIGMSEGLPRTLITILKHVYDWSEYRQEQPFRGGKISIVAQQKGVSEAGDWFLDHMLEEGDDSVRVRSALDRLSQLFRVNRFADKPTEISLIAFSANEVNMNAEARRILQHALDSSVLIDLPRGQRERNSEQITKKIELNKMLSPRWDLPVARRGVASFSGEESNAIFDVNKREEFEAILRAWESKMTAPAFGRSRPAEKRRLQQPDLFG